MKIAIVKLSSLGDIIHGMIVLQFITKQYPEAIIDWVVDESFKGILENHPHIRAVIPLELRRAKKEKSFSLLRSEIRKLKALESYDAVIDMQGLLKSALVVYLLKAHVKIGFDKHSIRESLASRFYNEVVNIEYSENTILRYLALLQTLGISVPLESLATKEPYVFGTPTQLPMGSYFVFVVHSTWQSRNYPVESFIEIANEFHIPSYVLHYTDEEEEVARQMSEQCIFIKPAPRMTLGELVTYIEHATLVIGNDTGPSYIAYATNTLSITLYGPTPENRIYPTSLHQTIKSPSTVNHRKLKRDDYSIAEISASEVITTAQALMRHG